MKKAPVSMCMITRRDPHLENCLKSFADYVEEICICINDPEDQESQNVALKYGAKVYVTTECNDAEGRIIDFSLARNKSLELATQRFIMWCDSDDIIVGMDKLAELLETTPDNTGYLFPYEYSYNERKQVLCRHYRERVVPRGSCHFVNPVHEVLVPIPTSPVSFVTNDTLIFQHQRQYNPKPTEAQRNLRILKDFVVKNPDDVRNMYYIGLEYANCNDLPNAVKYLEMYIDKSGWDDERAMAAYKLVDIYQAMSDYKTGLKWAYKSLEIKDWFESYFALCKMYYHLNNWVRSAHYGMIALQQPKTQTFLFVNDTDRFAIHQYLNVSLNNVGDVKGALVSALEGLKGFPDDANLNHNKIIYEKHLNIKPPEPVEKDLDASRMDIVFVAGSSYENWDPESVKKSGIGGSETMLINQARNLAALGHNVKVYASPSTPGTFDNVEYLDIKNFGNLACDVLVVSRYAPYLGDDFNVKAKLRLLWCHDVFAINATNELLLKADKILALSEWHKQNLLSVHNVHPDHILVTRNGIDLDKFSSGPLELVGDVYKSPNFVEKNKYRCINSSSPDRSWAVLLEVFPEIKKQVPEAELHLYYGFDNWKKSAANDPLQKDLIAKLEHQINNTEGVFYHGRVNENELITEFRKSGVWTYPTWFSETSCISAMQAIAAGCYVVTSNIAALKETVLKEVQEHNFAKLQEGDWTSPEYKAEFIKNVVAAMNYTERFYPLLEDKFGLQSLARDWNKMFLELIENKKTHPVLPYQPTKMYLKPKKKSSMIKLNIAAGPNVFPYDGWVNLDKYDFKSYFDFVSNPNVPLTGMPEHQQILANFLREGGDFKFVQHDMVKPFTQFADNSVDYIYVGQAIEHLNPIYQTPKFLKECHRMLKPGGILRMSTPDLDRLIRAYNGWAVNIPTMDEFAADQPDFYKDADPASQLAFLMFGACGPDCNQENYQGHFFCFNEKSMTRFLNVAGFTDVDFTWSKCGRNKEIAMEIKDEGISHSLIVEAVK